MAHKIATQEVVSQAAEALVLEGAEPSILAVQGRIGGGSFSTVKRFLDHWKLEKDKAASAVPDLPPDVEAKGLEFARAVWVVASSKAQHEAQQAKDAARAEVAGLQEQLVEALAEVGRLEKVEAENATAIKRQADSLRQAEIAAAAAQAGAARVAELEAALAQLRGELEEARVANGKLLGEAEALRSLTRPAAKARSLKTNQPADESPSGGDLSLRTKPKGRGAKMAR